MNYHIIELYIKHIIKPLETIIKSPNFTNKTSKQEQEKIDNLLLHHYRQLETLIKEQN